MRFSQRNIIYDAHLPEQTQHAADLVAGGFHVTLYACQLTPSLRILSVSPLVQLRLCRNDACNV